MFDFQRCPPIQAADTGFTMLASMLSYDIYQPHSHATAATPKMPFRMPAATPIALRHLLHY